MKRKKLSFKQAIKIQLPNLLTWKRTDWMFFFGIMPIVLLAIYLLPASITNSFNWDPQNANLVSAFMSHYTHTNFQHFIGNLIQYIVIAFLIFCIETKKTAFRRISLIILIVFPFLLTASQMYLAPKLGGLGFSGLLAAFLGYLPFSAYNYLKEKGVPLKSYFLVLIMLVNFGIMILTWQNIAISQYLMVLIGVLLLVYSDRSGLVALAKFTRQQHQKFKSDKAMYSIPMLIAVLASVYMFSLAAIVPQNINQGGQTINILVHYLGYAFAISMLAALEAVKETYTFLRIQFRW